MTYISVKERVHMTTSDDTVSIQLHQIGKCSTLEFIIHSTTYLHQYLGNTCRTKWLFLFCVLLTNVLQTLQWGPLEHKRVRIGQHSNELNNVRVIQGAQLVQFKAHITIASCQLSSCVWQQVIQLFKELHGHFQRVTFL